MALHTVLKTLILGIVAVWPAGQATAQTFPTAEQFLPVAILNQDRLYLETGLGQSLNDSLLGDARVLTNENRKIEADLETEERALTDLRKTLEPVAFSKLASAFNIKVEQIRREQTQKANDLTSKRITIQRDFLAQIQPIIIELMQERGIQFILNEQAIFMASNLGDITDDVIARINAQIQAEKQ